METLIAELLNSLKEAKATGGSLAVAGVALMYLIRILREDLVQSKLPAKWQWASWPTWLKTMVPFALAGAGSGLLAAATGVSVVTAIIQGISAGLAAIGLHYLSKQTGSMVRTEETQSKIKELSNKVLDLTLPKKS